MELLLHTAAQLETSETVRVLVVGGDANGDEDIDRLRELAKTLNVEEVFDFVGRVDQKDLPVYYNAADVCVVPSHSENFCMVVAEALAYGLPVIASQGTPWQAIEERACGLWVANDPQSLVRAILIIRKMNLAHMGRCGRAWMRGEFGWDVVADNMLGLYRSLIR